MILMIDLKKNTCKCVLPTGDHRCHGADTGERCRNEEGDTRHLRLYVSNARHEKLREEPWFRND